MTAFRYSAADSLGKDQVGVLEADSARQARQALRNLGLIPLSVEPVETEAMRRSPGTLRGRRLSQTELAVLTRQFASLLAAALPIADALTVRGIPVEHILSEQRTQRHTLKPWAKVEGTRITYPHADAEAEDDVRGS